MNARWILVPALAALLITAPACSDEHAGHDHDAQPAQPSQTDDPQDHTGHDHDAPPAEDDHEAHAEDVVRLSPEQLARAGVRIEPLGGGTITTHLTLPAEVGLNLDAVVHMTPRAPGVVLSVSGLLGHEVRAGAVLAVIESAELGEAKIEYLRAVQSQAVAAAELTRQRTISANTEKLLEILQAEPSLDELRAATADLPIGDSKGRLTSGYARVRAAEANYTRERDLRSRNLSTESDLLAAQEAFNITRADYFAAFEEIDFAYRLRLQEAERIARFAASAVDNARRRLRLMGLDADQIAAISHEPDASFARYALTAPIEGRIVDKHITPGEKLGTDASVYTIADLRTVWLNVSVFSQYATQIAEGQAVVVHADGRTTTGVVDYVSALVTESTRTLSARVVLDNADRSWKPGTFVTARVETGAAPVARAVPLDAVQTFEGRTVVFVQDADGIEPVPVVLGRRNQTMVEIVGDDIPLDSPVVVANAFLMKSELGKSAAGHQH